MNRGSEIHSKISVKIPKEIDLNFEVPLYNAIEDNLTTKYFLYRLYI